MSWEEVEVSGVTTRLTKNVVVERSSEKTEVESEFLETTSVTRVDLIGPIRRVQS